MILMSCRTQCFKESLPENRPQKEGGGIGQPVVPQRDKVSVWEMICCELPSPTGRGHALPKGGVAREAGRVRGSLRDHLLTPGPSPHGRGNSSIRHQQSHRDWAGKAEGKKNPLSRYHRRLLRHPLLINSEVHYAGNFDPG